MTESELKQECLKLLKMMLELLSMKSKETILKTLKIGTEIILNVNYLKL